MAAGSAACLVGCSTGDPEPPRPDGALCEPPIASPPPDLDYPEADYFAQVSRDLDAASIGTPVVFIDMDRVDANIDAIVRETPDDGYRIVEKSLPSLDLLSYVSERSGSDKFMVLHLPFLAPLLDRLPNAEVLIGKSHLTSAVAGFFDGLPAGTDLAAIARRVTFLADTPTRLDELTALAGSLGVTLKLAIELDVGLRRSGLNDPSELAPMLRVFLSSTVVEFAGFLGYDGHIAFSPGGTVDGMYMAWSAATEIYQSFVDIFNGPEFEALASPTLVFNSGGSSSYPMYSAGGTPVNDVAAGGGVLRPGSYPDHVISELQPAIFIATPVFRVYPEPRLPFFTAAGSAGAFEGRQGLTIGGGGWPAYFTHPPDIQPAPLVSDATDHSMVPNQGLVTAPADTPINPGDWIYYHPRQSDALFQFEKILLVRGGRLQTETMAAYPRRY
ncbi:MAG: alanine racemase [Deltaproteobacteria bacterium]|nr:alanine racemase [Deltaproteobacteria bacterium]